MMKHILKAFAIIWLAASAISLSGCTTVLETAFEDRAGSDIAKDAEIKTKLLANVADQLGASAAAAVSAIVYEQSVLLSGEVESSSIRSKAVSIAKSTPEVNRVINELKVASGSDEGMEQTVDDFLINQTIHVQSAGNTFINHTNWRWNSVNGTVYLFGRSLTSKEQADMRRLVKEIDGVRSVVDHSFVRGK